MVTIKRMQVKLLVAISMALYPASSAWADSCATRHFYNNSKVQFVIEFVGSDPNRGSCSPKIASISPAGGHVVLVKGSNPFPTTCSVNPGGTLELHYSNLLPDTIAISGANGYYNRNTFLVATPFRCYIYHDGNTGRIAVNDPADGDIRAF